MKQQVTLTTTRDKIHNKARKFWRTPIFHLLTGLGGREAGSMGEGSLFMSFATILDFQRDLKRNNNYLEFTVD